MVVRERQKVGGMAFKLLQTQEHWTTALDRAAFALRRNRMFLRVTVLLMSHCTFGINNLYSTPPTF